MMAWTMRAFTLTVVALIGLTAWALSHGMPWPAALATAALLAVLVHAALVAAGFLLARAEAKRAGEPAPPGWAAAALPEILLSIRNMYVDIPWRHRWPARLPDNPRGAVLLVHGYGCNRGIWRDLDDWLAARGWAVAALDLEPPRGNIDEFGRQVAAEAAALAARTGAGPVIVIGHSMGGLAARAALRCAPDAPIGHIITIGTPHGGTRHARFGRGLCAAQMMPGHPWLTGLCTAERPGWPSLCTCIASRHDNIVAPVSRALLPGAAVTQIVERVGHMAMLHHPAVREFLAARLAQLSSGPATPAGNAKLSGGAPGR